MYPDPKNVELIKFHLKSKGFGDAYSESSLMNCLHSRMQRKRCLTYKNYLNLLQDEEEFKFFSNNLSINVTSFFRDQFVFKSFLEFYKTYMTEIIDRKEISDVEIWSVGCANGSEPYTVAMILHKAFENQLSRYNIKIHATDVNKDILGIAKSGVYSQPLEKDVPQPYLDRYFHQSNSKFVISDKIKKMVTFTYLDLLSDSFPFNELDIIFCRYVLMYFQKSHQKKLIKRYYELLKPGGFLILGTTDPIPSSEQNIFIQLSDHDLFLPLSNKDRIYQKQLSKEQRERILASLPEEFFFCEWCGKHFYTVKMLNYHLKQSSCRKGELHCYICGNAHYSRTGLVAHLKYSQYIDQNDPISLVFNRNIRKTRLSK